MNTSRDLDLIHERNPKLKALADGSFVGETSDDSLIVPAKRILAQVYIELGFYTEDDLDEATGMFLPEHDEPHTRARYFISGRVVDGAYEFLGMARLISFDPALGLDSFPLTVEAPIGGELEDRLSAGSLPRAQEVSELVANPHLPGSSRKVIETLYASMFQTALRENHEVWLLAARPTLFKQLERRFTSECIRKISPIRERPGEIVIPAMLDIAALPRMVIASLKSAEHAGRQDRVKMRAQQWRRYLDGLTVADFTPAVADELVSFGVIG